MKRLEGIRLYKERHIESLGVINRNQWNIKKYTICTGATFDYSETIDNYINQIDGILDIANSTDLPVYNVGFLIVHQGTDRLWFLFNWWTGGEMLESVIHYVDYVDLSNFKALRNRSLVCIWELEIFAFERKAWIEFVLNNPHNPKIDNYLQHKLK